jgi:hypothetical protein
MVFVMQFVGFALTHLTVCDFAVNAPVLIGQAMIYLGAAGMRLGPMPILRKAGLADE